MSETIYGYTNEYTDSYIKLIYLRSRMYDPLTGRFTTKDSWQGDYNSPLSLNRWNYVEANPVKYTDPSGFCSSCYIFLFPGAGNQGDVDNNGNLEDNLGREIYLVEKLRSQIPDITVKTVYPYGAGVRTNWEPVNGQPSLGQDSNGNIRFAIVPSAYQLSPIPAAKAQEIQDYYAGCIKDDKYNITFLGYSGGGQMAYSTAQNLTGRMQVDSLVLLGAPFRAYSGLGNIGRIWDLAWLDDPFKGMEKNLEWDRYNSGYRTVFHLGTSETNSYGEEVYLPEEDIYRNGATKCTFYGPNHQHYGAGDYFDTDASAYSSSGIICTGPGYGFHMSNPDNGSRVDVLVNFLINVVGVGREK